MKRRSSSHIAQLDRWCRWRAMQLRLRRKDKIVETWTKLLSFFDSRIVTKPEQRRRKNCTQNNHFIHWNCRQGAVNVVLLFKFKPGYLIIPPPARRSNSRSATRQRQVRKCKSKGKEALHFLQASRRRKQKQLALSLVFSTFHNFVTSSKCRSARMTLST